MGRKRRTSPARLGEKLLKIRRYLNYSQTDMLKKISPDMDTENRAIISEFERNRRSPSPLELLTYARLCGLTIEMLVDDDLDLPSHFK